MTISSGKLPHAWDAFDAYLFDIDGTLLHCADAVHYFAFCETLSSIAGRPLTLEGVTAHGNTDVGILRDVLALAGVSEEHWRSQLEQIKQRMCDAVRARKQEVSATALPGVVHMLEHLRGKGALLGVATGNLRATGQIKLERAGLHSYFSFAGWSDDFEYRADVFRAAAAQARGLAGESASICVVGDTPADVRAARSNRLPVIAVATGIFSAHDLRKEVPDWCVSSLQELLGTAYALPA